MSFTGNADRSPSGSTFDISKVSPGAYAAQPESLPPGAGIITERMTMDIDMLRKQYRRLRQRQQQAHIILSSELKCMRFMLHLCYSTWLVSAYLNQISNDSFVLFSSCLS